MGMCKGCNEVYNTSNMKNGYCTNCIENNILTSNTLNKKDEMQYEYLKDYYKRHNIKKSNQDILEEIKQKKQ